MSTANALSTGRDHLWKWVCIWSLKSLHFPSDSHHSWDLNASSCTWQGWFHIAVTICLESDWKPAPLSSYCVFHLGHAWNCDVERRWCSLGGESRFSCEDGNVSVCLDWPVSQRKAELLSCTLGEDPQGQNWCLWLHPQPSNKARLNSLGLALWDPHPLAHPIHM